MANTIRTISIILQRRSVIKSPSIILGIETSCDETAAAIVRDGRYVLSSAIASSLGIFRTTGGVVPETAARKQLESMLPVIEKALKEAQMTLADIDAIAVTYGPGLLGSLLVGTTTARVLSALRSKPLVPVHHTLGHLSSIWLTADHLPADEPQFPVITLSVSGGHSDIWFREDHTHGCVVSATRDDAAGEAFDKGATLLGLGYPGGPALANMAIGGNEHAFAFPLPLKNEETVDFSFSGLKTSLKYLLRDNDWLQHTPPPEAVKDLAASFQFAICRHLADRVVKAVTQYPVKEVHVVGGVSANLRLRALLSDIATSHSLTFRAPSDFRFCTDNAAMIASAGYFISTSMYSDQKFRTEASVALSQAMSHLKRHITVNSEPEG